MKTPRCTTRSKFTFLACFSCLMLANSFFYTAKAASSRQKFHMKQVKLYDSNGFKQPVVTRTFLMPADWQVAGGVKWNTHYDPNQPAYFESFSAVSPDGQVGFDLLPSYSWIWYTDPSLRQMLVQSGSGARLAPPLDAVGVVQQYIIPNYRPGATVVSVKPRPDLANALRQQLIKLGLAQLEANGCRVTLDFVEARIAYTQNGVRYVESAVVQLFRSDFSSTGMQTFTASNMFLFKAPEKEWEDHQIIYATALSSMRQNPAWLKAINQFHKNMARIRQQGAVRRQQIMNQMYEEMRESQQKSWEHRQESIDHVAREFSESIREVETYHDPETGYDVELPQDYEYAFSNGLGDYIITNDPLYNPNQDLLESNWHPLQAAP
ncbi:hypothetical protein [Gimesia maris]|uniref:hypothetical protein n=1 Tax=Gimesia maris TaxID=122 RepID=UPI00241D61D4|nr:hypothetical protein [Gimesia maris]